MKGAIRGKKLGMPKKFIKKYAIMMAIEWVVCGKP
jgi:hypothetical protein